MTVVPAICLFLLASTMHAENISIVKPLGAGGANKITLCLGVGNSCEGILLADKWASVEASCVFRKRPEEILILRQGVEHCAEYDALNSKATTRRAGAIFNHPEWHGKSSDVALVVMDKPFSHRESNPYFGKDDDALLKKYEPWINEVMISYIPIKHPKTEYYVPRAVQNPAKTFLFTIVLPSFAFIIFFIYFIFYTGNSDGCKVNKLDNNQFDYKKMDPTF